MIYLLKASTFDTGGAQMPSCDSLAIAFALRAASSCGGPGFSGIRQFTYRGSGEDYVNWIRRGLLELWAMAVLAAIVGFLGPFGTYLDSDFLGRLWQWFIHLMGAYVLVRPTIWLLAAIANATSLPRGALLFWGVLLASFPLAVVWRWGASMFFHALGGFAGILPFALLSASTILFIVWWAKRIDELLSHESEAVSSEILAETHHEPATGSCDAGTPRPADGGAERLRARLGNGFSGPILALQSEDHYVRVHGMDTSELLLIRLRDAIGEMDGRAGQQVHRSWWVAKDAVASVEADGRNRTITLHNGHIVPVARDSIYRLEQDGMLPVVPRP